MIKVLADRSLAFSNGERDRNGSLIHVKTKPGFCELPEWVEKHPYFQMAVKDGCIKPYKNTFDSEAVLKEQEKLQALRDEIKALEEKKELLNTDKVTTKVKK